jgi:hypothetical protein
MITIIVQGGGGYFIPVPPSDVFAIDSLEVSTLDDATGTETVVHPWRGTAT